MWCTPSILLTSHIVINSLQRNEIVGIEHTETTIILEERERLRSINHKV